MASATTDYGRLRTDCFLGNMSRMTLLKAKVWSVIAGVVAGGAVSITAFLTVGVYLLFNVFYGCAPQHRIQPNPDPCSGVYMAAWTIAILLAGMALFAVTFVFMRRLVLRKLPSS